MAGLTSKRLGLVRDALGYATLAGACAVAVSLCLAAEPEAPPPRVDQARASAAAAGIVRQEPARRRKSRAAFPGDLWSQDDAFHNSEQQLVRAAARKERLPIGSVLDALDERLRREHGPDHKHGTSPCKPRPIYD